MIFIIDIGNTNIVIALYEGGKQIHEFRITTDKNKMVSEYELIIYGIMKKLSLESDEIVDVVISSVVPEVCENLSVAFENIFSVEPKLISLSLNLPFDVEIDGAKELGADFISSAASAVTKYSTPVVVGDLGTATKFLLIDENKNLMGVSILAGVMVSYSAITNGASLLSEIEIEKDAGVVGRTTSEALSSGFLYGSASLVDGMFRRFAETLPNTDVKFILTGGIAPTIYPYLLENVILDNSLVTDGIYEIYKLNYKN